MKKTYHLVSSGQLGETVVKNSAANHKLHEANNKNIVKTTKNGKEIHTHTHEDNEHIGREG